MSIVIVQEVLLCLEVGDWFVGESDARVKKNSLRPVSSNNIEYCFVGSVYVEFCSIIRDMPTSVVRAIFVSSHPQLKPSWGDLERTWNGILSCRSY